MKNALGGSATYFSLAASLYNTVDVIATVGKDFPRAHLEFFKSRGIGIDGLEVADGKTFRWEGRYDAENLNMAHTLATHLNVFKDFDPRIPKKLAESPYLFLANIDPDLQYKVLRQIRDPRLVACDSMNFWITHKRSSLVGILPKIDIFFLNDTEAQSLTGENNLLRAAKAVLRMGPGMAIVKKGEHGVLCVTKKYLIAFPAYPVEVVRDPTGAGDSFAGGIMGYLSTVGSCNEARMKRALTHGTIIASFTVEGFGVSRLAKVTKKEIAERIVRFKQIIAA